MVLIFCHKHKMFRHFFWLMDICDLCQPSWERKRHLFNWAIFSLQMISCKDVVLFLYLAFDILQTVTSTNSFIFSPSVAFYFRIVTNHTFLFWIWINMYYLLQCIMTLSCKAFLCMPVFHCISGIYVLLSKSSRQISWGSPFSHINLPFIRYWLVSWSIMQKPICKCYDS